MNHISEKTLEKETWFNKQLNNLSKLNSKVAELTACSHDPFPASATNMMYDTFDVGTIFSMEGGTSGTTPTFVDGCIAKKSNKHFSSDNDTKDSDSKSSHSPSGDNTEMVSGKPIRSLQMDQTMTPSQV